MYARYPTQDALAKQDGRNRCKWFYSNKMKRIADMNHQTVKIRKIRNGGHYAEVIA